MSDFTGEGTYVCTLDEATLKKAKDELNEKPKDRADQIEILRNWVKQEKHLTCRTDDHFLLRFLRRSKFSQMVARELIENFLMIRCSPCHGVPEWFEGSNEMDADIMRMFDLGTHVPLPGRDDKGRKVILIRTGAAHPRDFEHTMRAGFMATDILLRDEANQVHGFVVLLDFSEFSKSHVPCWGPETVSKAMKCWQDVYPTRNKGINYYKTPPIFNIVMDIFKVVMKQKIKERLHFHKGDVKSLHKQIPKRILPTEYGGEAGPLEKIKEDWKNHVINNADEFALLSKLAVDETKLPPKFRQQFDEDDGWGMTGTFRKLNVD